MSPAALPPTRWILRPTDPDAAARLSAVLGLSSPIAQALLHRGYRDPDAATRFLRADLASLSDPAVLLDLPRVAERILRAARSGERIIVYGDYDADGVTSTAILFRSLQTLGARVEFFIPRREVEGYGLHPAALTRLGGPGLLIAADCGISAVDEVDLAVSLGLAVVILDHHEPGAVLPRALGIVAPRRADQPPVTPFAACGLALQVVRAVWRLAGREGEPVDLLDLAAIGTLADVVPLVGDNRILARQGLARLSTAPSLGVAALLREADVTGAVRPRDVTFGLAPRLNAAGRLGDARTAVALLITDDPAEAARIAQALDGENRQRQAITEQVLTDATARVEEAGWAEAPALVVAGEGWHPGVVGIVASHLKERYNRPVVMIAVADGVGRGSARSIEALPMVEALDACADLLLRYGGHAMAAGLTIRAERVEEFRARFLAEAGRRLRPEDLVPAVIVDAELDLGDLTPALAHELGQLAPFGPGNPEPVFALRGLRAAATRVVGDGHLRLGLTDGQGYVEAIGFARGDVAEVLAFTGARLDLAAAVELDRWGQEEKVMLVIRDVQAPGLDLDTVLADGALLVERLFARAEDYLGVDFRGIEEAWSFHTKVAGVTFDGRQALLPTVRSGQALRLVREPGNPHDPHAVAVVSADGRQLGYLSARLAGRLAPSMDAGARYSATASQVTGGGDRAFGLNVFIQREEAAQPPEQLLWRVWRELPSGVLIDRIRLHLHPGQPLREVQAHVIRAVVEEGAVTTVLGPGRRGAITAVMTAAALAASRGTPALIVLPLARQVDRWMEAYAPGLRAAGFRVYRAHGVLGLRAQQRLLRAIAEGGADILLASAEWLRRGGLPGAPPGAVVVTDPDSPQDPPAEWLAPRGREAVRPEPGRPQARRERPALATFLWDAGDAGGEIPGATVGDGYIRTNVRLVDRRGEERDRVLGESAGAGKRFVYVPDPAEAVAVARRLGDQLGPEVAYYHGGLPARIRRVLEQLFLDGKITTLVGTASFPESAAPGDISQVVLAGLPPTRTELVEVAALAGLAGRSATVLLAFGRADADRARAWLDDRFPPRQRLADLYRILRDAGKAPLFWPGEALAGTLAGGGWSSMAVQAALEILGEAGVLTREDAEGRWRIELAADLPRRDLSASARFAEGMRERDAFEALLPWAFGPASAILRSLARARPAS